MLGHYTTGLVRRIGGPTRERGAESRVGRRAPLGDAGYDGEAGAGGGVPGPEPRPRAK